MGILNISNLIWSFQRGGKKIKDLVMNVFGVKETDEEEPRPKNEFVLQKIVFRDEVHAALKFHFSGKKHKTRNGLKCAN